MDGNCVLQITIVTLRRLFVSSVARIGFISYTINVRTVQTISGCTEKDRLKKQSHCGVLCKQLLHYRIRFPSINIQVTVNRDFCCLFFSNVNRIFQIYTEPSVFVR